ncbi:MAG: hypothetical protein K0S51_1489 [Bacillales bacterium]|jgi:glycosyltransferase involved in cell wall biosynthesis|nr:hypothetical protein [Bacillales bacterium]
MLSKARTLFLLTNRYPYRPGEEFLEEEIKKLSQSFDNVYIIPFVKNLRVEDRRNDLPNNVVVKDILVSNNNRLRMIIDSFVTLFDIQVLKWILSEKGKAIKHGMNGLKKMIIWIILASKLKKAIIKSYKNNFDLGNVYFYSYWLSPTALALALAKDDIDIYAISRVHGTDLFEERHSPPYLPFQEKVINTLNHTISVSKMGTEYLEQKFRLESKVSTSYLGTRRINKINKRSNDRFYRIVSCSYMVPIKRLHLIIDSLEKIDLKLEWTHIGGGPLKDELTELSKSIPKNVTVNFLDTMNNNDVMDYYTEVPIDLFINVSELEGLPVSIMEVFSVGIPVCATDVGGTSEIVNEKNGYLLEKKFKASDLREVILNHFNKSQHEIEEMRKCAYETWCKSFSSEENYSKFIREYLN